MTFATTQVCTETNCSFGRFEAALVDLALKLHSNEVLSRLIIPASGLPTQSHTKTSAGSNLTQSSHCVRAFSGALQSDDLIVPRGARALTFSPLISFRCSWRLRLTSRMRFPWSRITLILSASERRSRRTRSSLVHFSMSSSLSPEMSSAGLSVFAMDSWSWGWGGVALSIGTAPPAPVGGLKTLGRFGTELCAHPLPPVDFKDGNRPEA